MKTTYVCEITKVSFDSAEECAAHEQSYRERSETFKKNVDLAIDEIEKIHGVKVIRDTLKADDGVHLDYHDYAHDYTYVQFDYLKGDKEFTFSVDSDPVGDYRDEWYGDKSASNIVSLFYVENEGNASIELDGFVSLDDGKLTVDDVDLVDLFKLLNGREVVISVPAHTVKDIDLSKYVYEDDPVRLADSDVIELLRKHAKGQVGME